MDWISVGKQLIAAGLPVLGTLLFGPAGATVGTLIAHALGAPAATPEAVSQTIGTTTNDVLIAKLKAVEDQAIAVATQEAEVAKVGMHEVGETMRVELQTPATTRFEMFQKGWRPLFAYELLIECCGSAVILGWEVITGNFQMLNQLMQFQGYLEWYYTMRFGVLGVQVLGRSWEKSATAKATGLDPDTGVPDAGLVGAVVQAVLAKLKVKK